MTTQSTRSPVRRRPRTEVVTVTVLIFLGVTALVGGVELLTSWLLPSVPQAWLGRLPLIDSWTVPALVLGIGFGLGSLVTAYGMLRRESWRFLSWVNGLTGFHWSWLATILLGVGMIAWITLELIYLPEGVWLEIFYGVVGLILVTLPLTPSMRADLRA